MPDPTQIGSNGLALIVVDAGYERLHAAFMMAATVAALGRQVTVFGMGAGVAAFHSDWAGVPAFVEEEARRQQAGVAGLEELRAAVVEMGGQLMVCDSGLRAMGLAETALLDGVKSLGLPSFLDHAGPCRQLVF